MTIYLVQVNGKISQEAYRNYDDAAKFIASRILNKSVKRLTEEEWHFGNYGYVELEHQGNTYIIHDVQVK